MLHLHRFQHFYPLLLLLYFVLLLCNIVAMSGRNASRTLFEKHQQQQEEAAAPQAVLLVAARSKIMAAAQAMGTRVHWAWWVVLVGRRVGRGGGVGEVGQGEGVVTTTRFVCFIG